MSRTVLGLLVVAAMLSAVLGGLPSEEECGENAKKCGENEEWSTCATLCPPTCDKRKPGVCPLICIKGCTCKSGFLRNRNNKCVLPCQCDCE